MSVLAHFFVVVCGSLFHERLAHFFVDIYTYDDKLLMTFVSDFKSSNAYKESFNKSVELAKLRNVPENERIKSKADIDCYFRGGSLK